MILQAETQQQHDQQTQENERFFETGWKLPISIPINLYWK